MRCGQCIAVTVNGLRDLTFSDIVPFPIHSLNNLGSDSRYIVNDKAIGDGRQFEEAGAQILGGDDTVGSEHEFIGLNIFSQASEVEHM